MLLNNAIIDTAKTTANMPWIIDKNAGIPFGKIIGLSSNTILSTGHIVICLPLGYLLLWPSRY